MEIPVVVVLLTSFVTNWQFVWLEGMFFVKRFPLFLLGTKRDQRAGKTRARISIYQRGRKVQKSGGFAF